MAALRPTCRFPKEVSASCFGSACATWRHAVPSLLPDFSSVRRPSRFPATPRSLTSPPQAALYVSVRDVSGGSDHREPGHPVRQAGDHPRRGAHAPGLLHHPGGDTVQHHARRHQNHLRQEVPPAVPHVSSGSHASQPAGHPRGHQGAQTQLLHRHSAARADGEQQRGAQPARRGPRRCPV